MYLQFALTAKYFLISFEFFQIVVFGFLQTEIRRYILVVLMITLVLYQYYKKNILQIAMFKFSILADTDLVLIFEI